MNLTSIADLSVLQSNILSTHPYRYPLPPTPADVQSLM